MNRTGAKTQQRSAVLIVILNLLYVSQSMAGMLSYADQHLLWRGGELLLDGAEAVTGIMATPDNRGIQLAADRTSGSVILAVQSSGEPFNQGLPSWNGLVAQPDFAYFKVFMRFFTNGNWSPWLTVGFWKRYYGSEYGTVSYTDGEVEIDYVKLTTYCSQFQFKVEMVRSATAKPSPILEQLSFLMSDSRTTSEVNLYSIVNDNPAAIFIPTTFYYQYALDPDIGGSICSPTSVSMILRSYDIEVNPVAFALDTKDPYWGIFGVWPRVVQNACEYGVVGYVNRYRTWSDAYEVLANGGRIAMSLGSPLYTGHLVMLAGFTSGGTPIVHDPAKSNGYGYIFDKEQLSRSWFNKGGIAYTFYPPDSQITAIVEQPVGTGIPPEPALQLSNFPNPFNAEAQIRIGLKQSDEVSLVIYNLAGQPVSRLFDGFLTAGQYQFAWRGLTASGQPVSSGIYIARLVGRKGGNRSHRLILAR